MASSESEYFTNGYEVEQFQIQVTSGSQNLVFQVGFGGSNLFGNMGAIAATALSRPELALLPGGFYSAFLDQDCPNGLGACYSPANDALYIGRDRYDVRDIWRKHIIGHELGHMVSYHLAGMPLNAGGYNAEECTGCFENPCPIQGIHTDACTLVQECQCTPHVVSANAVHCLQSREFANDAAQEGWGHFYATSIFNAPGNPGSFSYYKEIFFYGGVEYPPYNYEVVTDAVAWLENFCLEDGASDRGVELDWQFFFYNIHRSLGSDNYSMEDIGQVYAQTGTQTPTWNQLATAAQTLFPGNKGAWWQFAGDWYGINH